MAKTITNYVSKSPTTVSETTPLKQARERMFELSVRHLPVLHDGAVVGILSERDILLIESITEIDDEFPVKKAMHESPFTVGPHATLSAVAAEMAERKIGTAVVVDVEHPSEIVGIFTTVDALRALSELAAESE